MFLSFLVFSMLYLATRFCYRTNCLFAESVKKLHQVIHVFLSQFGPITKVKMQNKYAHVHVTRLLKCPTCSWESKRDLQLNDNKQPCEVTLRPMFGLSVFVRHRPFYVLPVGRHTCVCQLCYGMRHIRVFFYVSVVRTLSWAAPSNGSHVAECLR